MGWWDASPQFCGHARTLISCIHSPLWSLCALAADRLGFDIRMQFWSVSFRFISPNLWSFYHICNHEAMNWTFNCTYWLRLMFRRSSQTNICFHRFFIRKLGIYFDPSKKCSAPICSIAVQDLIQLVYNWTENAHNVFTRALLARCAFNNFFYVLIRWRYGIIRTLIILLGSSCPCKWT